MSTDDQGLSAKRAELAALIERFTDGDGIHETPIEGLRFARIGAPSEPMRGVQEPSLCLIVQGAKQAMLGNEIYEYDASRYLVASVDLPVTGRVTVASPEMPYLCFVLRLSPGDIASLVTQAETASAPLPPPSRGLSVSQCDPELLDAALRLTRLLGAPQDIALLAPLVIREILYRLLRSGQGGMLRHISIADSQGHRVAKAIGWLRRNFHQPLRIEHIAREVHMSPSALHHHFKAITAMSPLQYQKQLRLQEARRLMLSEVLDAATASHRVGYESPSQFSREYSRMFGAPPLRDVERLRSSAAG
ncbi:AraC family transcriptional regulator [Pseudoxanthomonas wuyuanensis]|uniref:Transcriptional regulator, AraC family n=1 Tax=Pseudoxanthomonas wuyuanensis TaxID=1073196 RepID=A0A286DB98_9GAMM|nr:AraC family transcriptional regulator [Pseudoxanthomonas wuyuanensis]KAF1721773.1 AraC family transcriptional regulator [Pseudoxanthomonas wuyuanensis]SOD55917.1 transcriptional regulator, AraC family [Pseudoxanthomonas wuyuanensis]